MQYKNTIFYAGPVRCYVNLTRLPGTRHYRGNTSENSSFYRIACTCHSIVSRLNNTTLIKKTNYIYKIKKGSTTLLFNFVKRNISDYVIININFFWFITKFLSFASIIQKFLHTTYLLLALPYSPFLATLDLISLCSSTFVSL